MAKKEETKDLYIVKTLAMSGSGGKKIQRYISKSERVLNIITEDDLEPRSVQAWIDKGFIEKAKPSDVKAFEKFKSDKQKPKKKPEKKVDSSLESEKAVKNTGSINTKESTKEEDKTNDPEKTD